MCDRLTFGHDVTPQRHPVRVADFCSPTELWEVVVGSPLHMVRWLEQYAARGEYNCGYQYVRVVCRVPLKLTSASLSAYGGDETASRECQYPRRERGLKIGNIAAVAMARVGRVRLENYRCCRIQAEVGEEKKIRPSWSPVPCMNSSPRPSSS